MNFELTGQSATIGNSPRTQVEELKDFTQTFNNQRKQKFEITPTPKRESMPVDHKTQKSITDSDKDEMDAMEES